ncbi:MAG: hypothetical protein GC154_14005 [bacterium]|nr:hypothetical protein [bacterium]
MADAPEQQEGQQEERPKSKLPFIIAGFVVLLAVVGGVAYMLLGGSGSDEATVIETSEEPGYMHTFKDPFVGNLAPPDDQYMYTAYVTLEIVPRGKATEAEALQEIGVGETDSTKNLMPLVMQIITDELASKTRVELTSLAGRENIRAIIKNKLNLALRKAEIKEVYLRTLVN